MAICMLLFGATATVIITSAVIVIRALKSVYVTVTFAT